MPKRPAGRNVAPRLGHSTWSNSDVPNDTLSNTPARKQRITKVLENLVATGSLRIEGDGDAVRYFAVK
jgi:hypothetical protein